MDSTEYRRTAIRIYTATIRPYYHLLSTQYTNRRITATRTNQQLHNVQANMLICGAGAECVVKDQHNVVNGNCL